MTIVPILLSTSFRDGAQTPDPESRSKLSAVWLDSGLAPSARLGMTLRDANA